MGEIPPAVWLLAAAALVAVLPRRAQPVALLGAPLLVLAQLATVEPGATASVAFFGYDAEVLRLDALSRAFGVVFALAAILAGIYGLAVTGTVERMAALVYVGGALGVVFAGDWLTLFLFWELKAVASAGVIWAGRAPGSAPSGRRYLYAHLVGGTLLLAGIAWRLSATGELGFTALSLGEPGAWPILVGVLLSAAVPPLHAWLPDAYPRASVAGTVFLSAFTTKAAVYTLARGFPGVDLLVWLGVIMALYGTVYAVLANDIRRLLAYSIVSQVGYMVVAVGLGTDAAINGATAHAFAHILYKALLLMGAGAVVYATGRGKLGELGGLARAMPAVVGLYVVGALSIAGVPLFSGFVTKELTLHAAELAKQTVVVDLLKVASVGTFIHTGLKLPYLAWFARPRDRNKAAPPRPAALPASMLVAMGLAAAANIAIGLAPAAFYGLLPHPVEYTPYTTSHVIQSLQLLVPAALVFWLLAPRLAGWSASTLDLDWTYRVLPGRLVAAARAVGGHAPGSGVAPAAARIGQAGSALGGRLAREAGAGQHAAPRLMPTWLWGAVALVAFVGLLTLGLLR